MLCSAIGCQHGDNQKAVDLDGEPFAENEMSEFMGGIREQRNPTDSKKERGSWLFFTDERSRQINASFGEN